MNNLLMTSADKAFGVEEGFESDLFAEFDEPTIIVPDEGDAGAATAQFEALTRSAGPLHLTRAQRVQARNIVSQGARKMLAHEPAIHYTQGSQRWEGINHHLRIVKGQYPTHADCSSMTTWMLWNALTHAKRDLHIPDVVNGQDWRAGYTGTQRNHGRRVTGKLLVGDLIHYGPGVGLHVAIYIGGGMVFSHGSERGPYKLPVHYRGDFNQARRYIRAI